MDKDNLSVIGAIALNGIFGNKPVLARGMIGELGSIRALFSLPAGELFKLFNSCTEIGAPPLRPSFLDDAATEFDRLSSDGVRFITIEDPAYPETLRMCDDAPVLLYCRSCSPPEEIFGRRSFVSVVGTRRVSLYGIEWCRRIVRALSCTEQKPTIVSGLAIGTDICAHRSALDCGLPTIAVSPVGMDSIYPTCHARDAERIAGTPGCAVISDYPPGTIPYPHVFLRRNRIIAGLSTATILIESRVRGGGMSTSRLAFGYGREVYALPGRIDDLNSGGCNMLVARKIAEPIAELELLMERLNLKGRLKKKPRIDIIVKERLSGKLSPDELESAAEIALAVSGNRGISYSELCSRFEMTYSEISKIAGMLEMEGFMESDMLQRCIINSKFF